MMTTAIICIALNLLAFIVGCFALVLAMTAHRKIAEMIKQFDAEVRGIEGSPKWPDRMKGGSEQ